MIVSLARKLSTETLTNRLVKQPFNQTIINELSKRANRVSKCEIEGRKRIEKELEKFSTKLHLGYKNEAYFTELEMLNGFTCTFEDLSQSERQIYNNAVKFCRI
jgi:hypothetical protein